VAFRNRRLAYQAEQWERENRYHDTLTVVQSWEQEEADELVVLIEEDDRVENSTTLDPVEPCAIISTAF
jgi:hypothetical protein